MRPPKSRAQSESAWRAPGRQSFRAPSHSGHEPGLYRALCSCSSRTAVFIAACYMSGTSGLGCLSSFRGSAAILLLCGALRMDAYGNLSFAFVRLFPNAKATQKRIGVVAYTAAGRQFFEYVDVSSAQDHVIRFKGSH